MEEKILFKEKTHKFVLVLKIILVLIVVLCGLKLYDSATYYNGHVHDMECVGGIDNYGDSNTGDLFTEEDYQEKSDNYATVNDYVIGEYNKNKYGFMYEGREVKLEPRCTVLEYGSIVAANSENFNDDLEYIFIYFIIILFPLIPVCIISRKRSEFVVTENSIYGKKGHKNFNISYNEVIDITQEGKGIILETKNEKLKLSSLKNCNEIYNLIKPFVPEKPKAEEKLIAQSTNKINDITNILD